MGSFELHRNSSRPDEVEKAPNAKVDIDLVETAGHDQVVTYEESMTANLPKAHRDYLMQRHGTLELEPVPTMSPADPYNWPEWKVGPCPPLGNKAIIAKSLENKDKSE
jgi:hypothetical protein